MFYFGFPFQRLVVRCCVVGLWNLFHCLHLPRTVSLLRRFMRCVLVLFILYGSASGCAHHYESAHSSCGLFHLRFLLLLRILLRYPMLHRHRHHSKCRSIPMCICHMRCFVLRVARVAVYVASSCSSYEAYAALCAPSFLTCRIFLKMCSIVLRLLERSRFPHIPVSHLVTIVQVVAHPLLSQRQLPHCFCHLLCYMLCLSVRDRTLCFYARAMC